MIVQGTFISSMICFIQKFCQERRKLMDFYLERNFKFLKRKKSLRDKHTTFGMFAVTLAESYFFSFMLQPS